MKRIEGVLRFEYRGRMMEIPYCNVPWGSPDRLHLTDKKGCSHIVNLEDGKWKLLWHERFSKRFQETLDWVIKQELG